MPAWIPSSRESLAVVIGGAAGAYLRFAVTRALLAAGVAVPWPTLAINVAGSFVLGLVIGFSRDWPVGVALLGFGLCGGFTTFSAFSYETVMLLQNGRHLVALAYTLTSVALSVAAAALALRWAGQ